MGIKHDRKTKEEIMELSKQELSAIEVLTWEVDGIEVVDKVSSELAQELRNKCHDRIKSIKEFCSESVKAAHKAWKAAKAQENTFLTPVEKLKTILTVKLKQYADAVMAKEREAQKKIEELQKIASESHKEGHIPDFVPIPISISSSLDKGWRDVWEWEVENESLVPFEYWMLDADMVNAEVRVKKDKCNIPGIKVTKSKIPVSR